MTLQKYAKFTFLTLFALSITSGGALAADLAKGEKIFKKCKTCHTLEVGENKVGPSLHGVVGREVGTVEGFKYSKKILESGIVWTEENIDQYLESPKKFIPGNKMMFPGLKKQTDRENLIAFLKEKSG